MGTGPTRRRCCYFGTSRTARRRRARWSSPRSATPKPRFPSRCRLRSSTCGVRRVWCRLRLGGLSAEEVSEFVERGGRSGSRPGAAGGRASADRADRWQPIPDDRAVALGARDRCGLESSAMGDSLRVRWPSSEVRKSVREVVSQRLGTTEPQHNGAAGRWPRSRGRSSSSRFSRAPGLNTRSCASALEQAAAHGMIEEVGGRQLGLPVHTRARTSSRL